MRVIIGVNTLDTIDQSIYSNHAQMYFRLGREHPDIEFALNHPRRMSIDRMRNLTAKIAVENNFDRVVFLDDDVLLPHGAFKALLNANVDVVAGWTIIRGYPFNNMFFKFKDGDKTVLEHYNDLPNGTDGIVEVDAVGFSFVMIKTEILKAIPPPWFVTGVHNTEDIYFCLKLKKYLPDSKVFVHTGVKTGHLLGQEVIDPSNKINYSTYFKSTYPELCSPEPEIAPDRGDKYLEMVKSI